MPQGNTKPTDKKTRRIEVFRTGKFRAMNGQDITFSADDLKAIAGAYDYAANPAPVVIGHPKTDDPAWGWIKALSFDEKAGRLFADLGDLDPKFERMVTDGKFKRVSMSFHEPTAPNNPTPGHLHAKHVGFLGAKAPAVSGLTPVQFADGGDVTFEFGEPAMADIARLFRKLRDWMIEKEGAEAAEAILSDWQINWIDNAANRPEPENPSYAEEDDMVTPKEIEDREKALADGERSLREERAKINHDAHVAFAEQLVAEARLTKTNTPALVALMDSLSADAADASVSFAEGDALVSEKPVDTLKRILKAQPPMVAFGEADLGEDPETDDNVSFAAPDGAQVDPEGLALHGKAVAYQKQHPGTAYIDAVNAVS